MALGRGNKKLYKAVPVKVPLNACGAQHGLMSTRPSLEAARILREGHCGTELALSHCEAEEAPWELRVVMVVVVDGRGGC